MDDDMLFMDDLEELEYTGGNTFKLFMEQLKLNVVELRVAHKMQKTNFLLHIDQLTKKYNSLKIDVDALKAQKNLKDATQQTDASNNEENNPNLINANTEQNSNDSNFEQNLNSSKIQQNLSGSNIQQNLSGSNMQQNLSGSNMQQNFNGSNFESNLNGSHPESNLNACNADLNNSNIVDPLDHSNVQQISNCFIISPNGSYTKQNLNNSNVSTVIPKIVSIGTLVMDSSSAALHNNNQRIDQISYRQCHSTDENLEQNTVILKSAINPNISPDNSHQNMVSTDVINHNSPEYPKYIYIANNNLESQNKTVELHNTQTANYLTLTPNSHMICVSKTVNNPSTDHSRTQTINQISNHSPIILSNEIVKTDKYLKTIMPDVVKNKSLLNDSSPNSAINTNIIIQNSRTVFDNNRQSQHISNNTESSGSSETVNNLDLPIVTDVEIHNFVQKNNATNVKSSDTNPTKKCTETKNKNTLKNKRRREKLKVFKGGKVNRTNKKSRIKKSPSNVVNKNCRTIKKTINKSNELSKVKVNSNKPQTSHNPATFKYSNNSTQQGLQSLMMMSAHDMSPCSNYNRTNENLSTVNRRQSLGESSSAAENRVYIRTEKMQMTTIPSITVRKRITWDLEEDEEDIISENIGDDDDVCIIEIENKPIVID